MPSPVLQGRDDEEVTDRTTIPIGRLTKKIQRQSKAVTSSPPRVGPAIVATPATAPQTPNAAPRRSGGNVMVTMASVCGISIAAPRPWTARKPISQPDPARARTPPRRP